MDEVHFRLHSRTVSLHRPAKPASVLECSFQGSALACLAKLISQLEHNSGLSSFPSTHSHIERETQCLLLSLCLTRKYQQTRLTFRKSYQNSYRDDRNHQTKPPPTRLHQHLHFLLSPISRATNTRRRQGVSYLNAIMNSSLLRPHTT